MTDDAWRGATKRIAELERSGLNATINFTEDVAAAASAPPAGYGVLSGAALAVKDNIATLDFPTTCASRILRNYVSPFEATAVTRLKAAGAVVVCKTNMDEFGMGSSTEYSAFGPCHHPADPARVPGGSSGGSAALVAAGAVDLALGSETGGSVRQPASFCGVVGFKPSYGTVSRFGLVAFGSSLDQIGVLGTSSRSVASVVETISGHDPLDSTSLPNPAVRCRFEDDNLAGSTVGLPTECFGTDVTPPIREACDAVVRLLEQEGVEVVPVSLPHLPLAVATYYIIAPAEASANLARYDGVRYGERGPAHDSFDALIRQARAEGFGAEVKRRILVGTYVLSSGYYDAFYQRAQLTRGLIAKDFADVFASGVDLLFTPTTPTTAFSIGQHVDDPVTMYRGDQFVCPANLAGLPAVSFPIGRAEGLPIGGQLIGPVGGDARLLEYTAQVESRVDPLREV